MNTSPIERIIGSYRDPSGTVFRRGSEIFRILSGTAGQESKNFLETQISRKLISQRQLIETSPLSDSTVIDQIAASRSGFNPVDCFLFRHERLPLITYPFEWGFEQLRRAALFHLDLQLELLESGYTLKDATPYNIQFIGSQPILMDFGSIVRYQEDSIWEGHQQFCEMFLNPLLLNSQLGIPFQAWLRGSLEGIGVQEIAAILPRRKIFSPTCLFHVFLQASLQSKFVGSEKQTTTRKGKLPKNGLTFMLRQLRKFISRLRSSRVAVSAWEDYEENNSYAETELSQKAEFVESFIRKSGASRVADLGCNTGHFSEAILRAGAHLVVGFDIDPYAVDRAYQRSEKRQLQFNPLVQDLSNLSPRLGLLGQERLNIQERSGTDAFVALALIHHLVVTKHIPLPLAFETLIQFGKQGVIEFVPANDPMFQQILHGRTSGVHDYSEEIFRNIIERRGRILDEKLVSSTGRKLFSVEL